MDIRQQLIEKLNNVQRFREKQIIKFEDLEVARNYVVQEVKSVSTRYGVKILIETDENIIFMPERFNVFNDQDIQNLNHLSKEHLIMIKSDRYNVHFV